MSETIGFGDRLEILDLYARQAHCIDGGDAAGWAASFTEGGSFESPSYQLTAVGHRDLEKFAAESNGAAWARGDQLRHWLDQVVIDPVPGGASVLAYLLIVATSRDGSRIDRSLRVADDLVKVGGRWLVAARRVFRDDDPSSRHITAHPSMNQGSNPECDS
jgi:SnoaL-like domain